MTGRWVNNCWLNEHDIMENLTAERDDLLNHLRAVERKIESLRHEQYTEYREFVKKCK